MKSNIIWQLVVKQFSK